MDKTTTAQQADYCLAMGERIHKNTAAFLHPEVVSVPWGQGKYDYHKYSRGACKTQLLADIRALRRELSNLAEFIERTTV